MLLGLKLQVVLQLLVQGPMIVLLEVCETQAGIQAVHLEGPFASAQPLPPSMNTLCVQNVIRSQEEPRSQEPVEALEFPFPFQRTSDGSAAAKTTRSWKRLSCSMRCASNKVLFPGLVVSR